MVAFAVVVGAAYAIGLARRSYWALALPVTVLTGSALAVAFFLGRMLMTTPAQSDEV